VARYDLKNSQAWIEINLRPTLGTIRRAARIDIEGDPYARSAEITASQIVAVGGDWSTVGPQFDPSCGGSAPDLPPLAGVSLDPLPARRALVDALPLEDATALFEALNSGELGSREEKN
jgi:hypothetical protein